MPAKAVDGRLWTKLSMDAFGCLWLSVACPWLPVAVLAVLAVHTAHIGRIRTRFPFRPCHDLTFQGRYIRHLISFAQSLPRFAGRICITRFLRIWLPDGIGMIWLLLNVDHRITANEMYDLDDLDDAPSGVCNAVYSLRMAFSWCPCLSMAVCAW